MEKNPSKFRIDSTELAVRRTFIQTTREEVITIILVNIIIMIMIIFL